MTDETGMQEIRDPLCMTTICMNLQLTPSVFCRGWICSSTNVHGFCSARQEATALLKMSLPHNLLAIFKSAAERIPENS